MKKNTVCRLFALVLIFTSVAFAKPIDKKTVHKVKAQAEVLQSKVLSSQQTVEQLAKEASRSKDIKWKVCVNDVLVTIRGLTASATRAKSQLQDSIALEKEDAMKSALVLLKGLAESSEKAVADANACSGQVTTINTKTTVAVAQDKAQTGGGSRVDGSLGVGLSGDFVADRDNSVIHDSGTSDAAGSDRRHPVDTPDNNGDSSQLEDEMDQLTASPEPVDVSPTR